MNTKKYIIRLKPLGSYFFGGENTFGEGTGDSYNYFARSETMPQTSTIIGMLRYEILRRSGALDSKVSQDQWSGLIGEQSFSLDAALRPDTPTSFGLISAVSPVFLSDGQGKYYTPMPLDQGILYNKVKGRSYYSGCERPHAVVFGDFNPKTYANWLHWVDGEGNVLQESPFIFSERPGIVKNESFRKQNDDECYYKQEVVSLAKGFGFVFLFETTADNKLFDEERQCFVRLGADCSMFSMDIDPCDGAFSFAEYFSALHRDGRFLLLGDTYMPEKTGADFIWGESKSFRSILSTTKEAHSWNRPDKSALFHLLKPGGVVYGEKEAVEKLLKSDNLQKAGLNHYV